jgi:cytochrome c oxidase subunit 3
MNAADAVTASGAAALPEQFDDRAEQHAAAALGMWIFLATETLFFGALLFGYAVARAHFPEAFAAASRHTNLVLGTANTAVLLTSSLTMALAVRASSLGERKPTAWLLLVTAVLGTVFLGIKAVEYYHKFVEHLVPGPGFVFTGSEGRPQEIFFILYFLLTGVHALHLIIGIVLTLVIAWMARRGKFSPAYYAPVEISGLYWHFVDIIWIFLFPLLYLIGSH